QAVLALLLFVDFTLEPLERGAGREQTAHRAIVGRGDAIEQEGLKRHGRQRRLVFARQKLDESAKLRIPVEVSRERPSLRDAAQRGYPPARRVKPGRSFGLRKAGPITDESPRARHLSSIARHDHEVASRKACKWLAALRRRHWHHRVVQRRRVFGELL